MKRPDTTHVIAILVLTAVLGAALIATTRHRHLSPALDAVSAVPQDRLSAALRRCNRLGPRAAAKAHCPAIWDESRRRFFDLPARSHHGMSPAPMPGGTP